jgi:urease accessory protein
MDSPDLRKRSGYRWPDTAWVGLALCVVLPSSALAHTGGGASGAGFLTGFRHPLGGLDHVLAMLAVGMWGAQLGNPAIWVLPVAFPMVMAMGGVAGILSLPLPAVEVGVTLSVITLGSMIAFDQRPPLWVASLLVGFFAIFHGYAHGAELPGQTGALAYSAGFVSATGLIHLTGIGIGFVTLLPHGLGMLRAGGSAIAAVGLLLAGQLLLG